MGFSLGAWRFCHAFDNPKFFRPKLRAGWRPPSGSAVCVVKRPRSAPRARDLVIVYEDDAIVVVDKPARLLTVPLARREGAPSAATLIEARFRSHRSRRVFPVHRIDRDTS